MQIISVLHRSLSTPSPLKPKHPIYRKHKFMPFAFMLLSVIFALWPGQETWAQPYNNEWIQFDQTYYKIKVSKDGLHRIPYSTLSAAGLPADASGYRLYYMGAEIPLYISANTLSANDYIEFVGKKNDGQFDARLYQVADQQLSAYKSLFSDTASYFLTWQNPNAGLRFSLVGNDISTHPPAEMYFIHTNTALYANSFYAGRPSIWAGNTVNFPDFEACEGWVSTLITAGQSQNFNVPTGSVFTDGAFTTAECRVRITGRNNEIAVQPDHQVQISVNGTLYKDTVMEGYYCEKLYIPLPLSALGSPQTTVNIASTAIGSFSNNNSVAYVQITYPHSYNFENKQNFAFTLPDQAEHYIEITNFNGGDAPVLYDLSNQWRILPILDGGIYKVKLPQGVGSNPRHLFISNTTTTPALTTINTLTERHFTDYTQTQQQGNYILIAHQLLTQGAVNQVARYSDYRESYSGGNFDVAIADIDELYDQFAFGIAKHPLSIVNFMRFAQNTWMSPPAHLLLLGKALAYSDITTATTYQQCLVPTFGNSPSDIMLNSDPATGNWVPQTAIGRVPARTADELRAYLDKLIAYEASNSDINCELNDIWRKNVISLATANNIGLTETYAAEMSNFQQQLTTNNFAAYPLGTYQQAGQTTIPLNEFENAMNNGLGVVFFKGEQQNFYWRMDINTPDFYQNPNGRYPFIISQSEYIGNLHRTNTTMANDFVLAEAKGAIGFWDNAQKYYGIYNDTIAANLVERLSTIGYEQSIGQNILQTTQELAASTSLPLKYVLQNYTLAGDPALSIVPNRKTELSVQPENLSFYNLQNGDPLFSNPIYIGSNMPNFEARLLIHNTGKFVNDSVNVKVRRWLPNGEFVQVAARRIAIPPYNVLVSFVLPNDLPEFSGANTYFFTVDADDEVDEWCENNNVISQPAEIHPYMVGIEPNALSPEYRFYPIPARQNLYVTTPLPTQMSIFDLQGRLVQQQTLQNGLNFVDVSTLSAGYYCVKLNNSKDSGTKPLIIIK